MKLSSFLHLQALDFIVKNIVIADVSTSIVTLDMFFGEIDR